MLLINFSLRVDLHLLTALQGAHSPPVGRFETSRGEVRLGSGTNDGVLDPLQTSRGLTLLKVKYFPAGEEAISRSAVDEGLLIS